MATRIPLIFSFALILFCSTAHGQKSSRNQDVVALQHARDSFEIAVWESFPETGSISLVGIDKGSGELKAEYLNQFRRRIDVELEADHTTLQRLRETIQNYCIGDLRYRRMVSAVGERQGELAEVLRAALVPSGEAHGREIVEISIAIGEGFCCSFLKLMETYRDQPNALCYSSGRVSPGEISKETATLRKVEVLELLSQMSTSGFKLVECRYFAFGNRGVAFARRADDSEDYLIWNDLNREFKNKSLLPRILIFSAERSSRSLEKIEESGEVESVEEFVRGLANENKGEVFGGPYRRTSPILRINFFRNF